jgi:lycopene cyclase domain-containing protein
MTYLGFLAVFLAVPLAALGALVWRDTRRPAAGAPRGRAAAIALLVHVIVALVYTTPWDNYLVATGVWWYDPARVLGLTLGWVPLEEYLFFMLQPLLAGVLLLWLGRRVAAPPSAASGQPAWTQPAAPGPGWLRWAPLSAAAVAWLAAATTLALEWRPGTYLGLILVWALPPLALQAAAGGDVLWRYRRPVAVTLGTLTLYLCAADSLAITAGVWTIDPAQSLNRFLPGGLPVEEAVFFLVTTALVVFGMTLALAPEMWTRAARLRRALAWRVQAAAYGRAAPAPRLDA